MKYLLALLFLLVAQLGYTQLYVKGEDINEKDINYIIVAAHHLDPAMRSVFYDSDSATRGEDGRITDENKTNIKFANWAAAIEHMFKAGWEIVMAIDEVHPVANKMGAEPRKGYLFRKRQD